MKVYNRLYSIDLLRGIAALAVVFWHWQHMFFDPFSTRIIYTKASQPLYSIFHGFYNHGARSVDLFFVISGFVFFWLYQSKISAKEISWAEFYFRRVSRLYPLHIVTLVTVIGLQALYIRDTNVPFVYQNHNIWQGIQHLLGFSSWFPQAGYAFNGPFWSVSIELLLYLIFYTVCRNFSMKWWQVLALSSVGLLMRHWHPELARGWVGFFIGGMTYFLHEKISSTPSRKQWVTIIGLITLIGWVNLISGGSLLRNEFRSDLVFASSILFITLVERERPSFFSALPKIGDISYSIYLIHFPLQLFFALTNQWFGGSPGVFYTSWTLALYLGLLFPLGSLSHKYLESPMQKYLRSKLLNFIKNKQKLQPEVTEVSLY